MQRGAGRGHGTGLGGARGVAAHAGRPWWSCGLPPTTHLVVCRLWFSAGGGGGGGGGRGSQQFWGPSVRRLFGKRGWKQAGASCRQIAGFPKPCLCCGLITCGWRGESLALGSPARTAARVEGDGAPGGFCTTLRPERRALVGLRWKLQDFLPPRGVQTSLPLAVPPTLGVEQDSGSKCCGRGRAFRFWENEASWPPKASRLQRRVAPAGDGAVRASCGKGTAFASLAL